tara:strand:- start:41790 stop:42956 length:1167 start_codon:yes stop_codon:yes gene_type:complete
MSDTNRVALSYEKEGATYATAPASALEDVRYTGETLVHDTSSVSSEEIRSDRNISDVTRTGVGASGDTNHELSYAEFDDWLESGLLSATWSTADTGIENSVTTSVAAGTGVYTIDSTTWTVTPAVGDLLEIRGDAEAANNGYKVVTAATTTTFTVAETGTAVSAAQTLVIDILSQITNGTTFASYHLQKEFTDLTNIFELLEGMVIEGLNLEAALEGIVSLSFNWTGKQAVSPAPAATFAARNAVTANEVMNTVDHIPTQGEGAAHDAICLTNFTMALVNNTRQLNCLGQLGANDIGLGHVEITGGIQLYLEDSALMNLYTGNTATELILVFEDTLGNGYIVFLPQLKFSAGSRTAPSQDADVIVDLTYTAYLDATYGYALRIARFAA